MYIVFPFFPCEKKNNSIVRFLIILFCILFAVCDTCFFFGIFNNKKSCKSKQMGVYILAVHGVKKNKVSERKMLQKTPFPEHDACWGKNFTNQNALVFPQFIFIHRISDKCLIASFLLTVIKQSASVSMQQQYMINFDCRKTCLK